jgi:hypothetical protein
MIHFEQKGMFAPFTILTSLLTGISFPLLGSYLVLNLNLATNLYFTGVILVVVGGFTAQWMLAHTVHDLIHRKLENRKTLQPRTLRLLLLCSLIILAFITIYLTVQRGWPVAVFAFIGLVVCLYAEGLLHHESQMAFGAMFLVIGSFYVQVATLDIPVITWFCVLCIGLFAFFIQYGWLLFYRLDDYQFSHKVKNRSILISKFALVFLLLYFILSQISL